jgi:hypothetical protein
MSFLAVPISVYPFLPHFLSVPSTVALKSAC